MFKEKVKFYIKESERSEKLASKTTPAVLLDIESKFRDDKEIMGQLKDLQKRIKATGGATPAAPIIKSFLENLEEKNPKAFQKLADNIYGVKLIMGKHTPIDPISKSLKDRKARYQETKEENLKGSEVSKALKSMKKEDEEDAKEDTKAAKEWKAGKEVETDPEEENLTYGKSKTKNPEEAKRRKEFQGLTLRMARDKKKSA